MNEVKKRQSPRQVYRDLHAILVPVGVSRCEVDLFRSRTCSAFDEESWRFLNFDSYCRDDGYCCRLRAHYLSMVVASFITESVRSAAGHQ